MKKSFNLERDEKNYKLNQLILRAERKRVRLMHNLELSSHELRRKRTRSLILLGGLIEKVGLLGTFGIVLGKDLQKDLDQKMKLSPCSKDFLS